jgi:Zn-dependent protease
MFQQLPFILAALIPALTFHEWAHAAVAYSQGDRTAQRAGRLSLNPLVHLDVLGTLAIFMIGFGWAKPVPINPAEMRGKWSEFLVAGAGPATNLVLGVLFALLLKWNVASHFGETYSSFFFSLFQFSMILNFALCFFNLIPIGPLDGSTLVARLLPLRSSLSYESWNSRFGSMVLMGMILTELIFSIGILRNLIWLPSSRLAQWIIAL